MTSHYSRFCAKKAAAADLAGAIQLLSWDQEIYMPAGAANFRAQQLGTLAETRHNLIVNEIQPLVASLLSDPSLTEFERLNVQQTAVEIEKLVKLPSDFVALLARKTSESQMAWERAKAASDFTLFEAELTEMFDLKRREAEYYGYTTEPYDALLDCFDAGMTAAKLDVLFGEMKSQLQTLIHALAKAPQPETGFLFQKVDADAQWQFTLRVLKDMGFDFQRGRQDLSTHPFTSGTSPDDVRLTTRIDENNLQMALYSAIHEGGHGLYEQGLPTQHYGLPAAEACSLSIHESQSRVWENNVARSLPFCQFYFKDLSALFPNQWKGRTAQDLFRAVNVVEPSLIRILADELTYHFHIMIRYELEREILDGKLRVSDLPAAWNARYKSYLGIEPQNDAEGCLQDIHWSIGAIGYFPTYSLGSFYAAQFYACAQKQNPNLERQFAEGNFLWFKDWLNQNVYQQGRLYNSEDLCRRISGQGLQVSFFLNYIQKKMEAVYAVQLV